MGINSHAIARATVFLLLIFFSTPPPSAATTTTTTLTAYDALQQYDFPVGLLPKGITGYELDRATGKFKAYLNGSCSFSIDSYELKYKSTITGVIRKDVITDLKGIEVKVFFLWLDIVTVTRDEGELQFSVGIASADFAVDNFDESPTCGCGFDCVDGIRNLVNKSHGFLLSS